ncbi:MAG: hypothetical protein R3Y59_02865 [bacterium]
MVYYNNILCVEANWLIEQGVMSKPTYDKLSRVQDIQVKRRGCRGVSALVSYESLPERFKRAVDAKIDVYKAVRDNMIENAIEHSAAASAYYEEYRIDGIRTLPPATRREYYINAIILDAIDRVIERRRRKCRSINRTFHKFWAEITECICDLDSVKYPHKLPLNERALERKLRAYKQDGYEALIHKNYIYQHRNAAKVKNEVQESALAMLISDPRNLDDEQVMRLYNILAENMQWQKISSSTVAVWREKLSNDIYARRHGSKAYKNERAMQVKRVAPTTPLTFWCMDGWDVELMYKKTENGKTTYHNRLTCVFVLDVCNKYPIGYAIGYHESGALIKEALRNAAQHTEQLFGQMYRTTQLQCDNFAKSMVWDTYELMAHYVTPAAVGNAKSKIIEPWFKYFNKKYCQLMPNWSGFNITAKAAKKINVDFLNKFKHNFPTLPELVLQIESCIAMERKELLDDYIKRYNAAPAERKLPLAYEQYLLHYGATTGHRNLLQGSGLKVTIDGVKHDYDCFHPEFRRYSSTRWAVHYDPDDKRRALAVSEDGTLQFLLEEKYVQPMALADRQEGDHEQLERVWQHNREQAERTAIRLGAHQDNVSALLEGKRELETLSKLMLVDSTGQHKNVKSKARLARKNESTQEVEDATIEDEIYDYY